MNPEPCIRAGSDPPRRRPGFPGYRAYARAAGRLQCSGIGLVAGLVLIFAFIVVSQVNVPVHMAAILGVLRTAAALACTAAAAGLLLVCTRVIASYTGAHTDVLPGDEPQIDHITKPGVTAPMAVPGYHPGYMLRPSERAGMEATADAFADDGTGIVVSEDGDIYELARPAGAEGDDS
jgi:hypothetical protein